ncbi:glutathione S-transferase family protein [Bordetella bronchialis]|uniref:Glutathione S-transferase n=1 Tax=Bordetella bronchialis TaxID=463025 RepID=A0ABM6CMQ1_9BORD|nr:glutathione S-transferase family protein [Bordetella bronchialis]ANN65170.1 glutathione S-transferase [Bordetella bronchialis]
MIKFYFNPGPNPMKVALLLEELGLAYETVPVDMRKGDQHRPDYVAINPNAKVPALVDGDATIFDSNAILIYLAEKTGRFLPPGAAGSADRAQLLSWLMFIATGVGPYSGQAVYFRVFTPEPNAAALNRYDFEAERHWRILDQRLAGRPYLLGDTYTIADMAMWGWARMIPTIFGGEAAWSRFPNVKRLLDEIGARPAGVAAEALKTRYTFKKEMDEDARRQMFPQLARLQAGAA